MASNAEVPNRDIRVAALTPDRWDDAVAMFGTRGEPSFCWCQFFRLPPSDWKVSTRESNRAGLCGQAGGELPPGLLAYLDDGPVGWLALAPRPSYARLAGNARLRTVFGDDDLADESVWAVTCFVVRVGFRRKGIARALLDAAPDFARKRGARVLEGHPVDVTAKGAATASDLYHGVASTFVSAGYEEVARTSPTRPVMRLSL